MPQPPEVVDLRENEDKDDVYRAFEFAAKEVHAKRRHLLMTGVLAGSGVDLALEDLETLFDTMTTEFPRSVVDETGPLWQAFKKESETSDG